MIFNAGGSGGSKKEIEELKNSLNFRYNEETDFFEVVKNGEWVSTQIRAGLNKLYL